MADPDFSKLGLSQDEANKLTTDYLKNPPEPNKGSTDTQALIGGLLGAAGVAGAKAAAGIKGTAASKPLLGIITGPMAARWSGKNEKMARALADRLENPEHIYDATGLYLGHSGGFRKYVPDVTLAPKMLPKGTGPGSILPMRKVANWREMYENYPFMANFPVHLTGEDDLGASYAWDHIKLHGPVKSALTWNQLNSLAHEGQHGIQHAEGWPVGVNYSAMQSKAKDTVDLANDIPGFADKLRASQPNTASLLYAYGHDPKKIGDAFYLWHPGETEARLTETLLAKLKGKPFPYEPRTYSFEEAAERFRPHGIALGLTYGDEVRPHEWSIRDWGTRKRIDPNDLTHEQKNIWDYLPYKGKEAFSTKEPIPLGQQENTGELYPWKWEDTPRGLQNDYGNNP